MDGKKKRSGKEYLRLKKAREILADWWTEVTDACAARHVSESTLVQVSMAIEDVLDDQMADAD